MDVLRTEAVPSGINRLRIMQDLRLPLQALKDVYEVDCLECLAVALLQNKDISADDLYQLVLHRSSLNSLSEESAASGKAYSKTRNSFSASFKRTGEESTLEKF
jgi:hypothetical protein